MVIDFTQKELEALLDVITMELKETRDLINNSKSTSERNELSNYYDTLYMIKQKLI